MSNLREIEIEKRNEAAKKFVERYGAQLWHYTDVQAVNGLLKEKELWFGSTANMNDAKELAGFIDNLKEAVKETLNNQYEKKTAEVFAEIDSRLNMEYPYAFCLSRADDDAAQWERYANAGKGVAVVFNTEVLFKLVYFNRLIIGEEYYTYNAKQHQLCGLLVDYIKDDKLEGFSDIDGLIDNLLLCAQIHKHKSFSAEKEIRISPYFVKDDDPKLDCKVTDVFKRVYIVDLAEICKKENVDFESLIDAIVIGPKSRQNIEDFKWYLRKIELPNLADKIRLSECPLR